MAKRAPESLLVVRLGAMGDVIHTLAAVTALRSARPEMCVGWLLEERWAELLCARDTPRVGNRSPQRPVADFVHTTDTKHWRKSVFSRKTYDQIRGVLRELRAQHYDAAADFQGALKSAFFARASGAKVIFGFQHPREKPARLFYRQVVPAQGTHVVEQYFSLAEAIAACGLPRSAPELPLDEQSELFGAQMVNSVGNNFVLINPGAGWGAKQWPAERYGQVALALARDGYKVLINFGPGEEEIAAKVRDVSGGAAQPLSCSISELIALTRRARLFIGGDTGPLHLAAGLRVPVVAIFGPTDPARNGPYGTPSIVLRHAASKTSLSHTSAPDPGLLNISVEEVIAAARKLLENPSA
jgi:heptosyltransferase-1